MKRKLTVTLMLALVLVVLPWFIISWVFMKPPVVVKYRRHNEPVCLHQFRMIEGAKEEWASRNRKSNGDPVVVSEVNQYIKGFTTPQCNQGGTYSYNPVGVPPTCSIGQEEPKKERASLFSWRWSESKYHRISTPLNE